MKILHVITRGDRIGGAQNHVRDLAIRLDQDGHTVDVITGARGPLTEALDAAGIATHLCRGLTREIDPLNDPRAVWELRRAIVRLEPDLVATHSSKAGTIGRIAARLAGVPCVFTAHGWPFTEGVPRGRRMLFRQTERICAPLAAALICVSDFDLELARRAGIGGTRLIRIYNGMPGNASFPRARPGQTGPMRIVSAARFDQQKDHATLLRALARTEAAVLVLAGDGPLEPELRALARDLGVADRVDFVGRRDDVPALLGEADLFVLSSRWEGFPLSTLEAMRAGLPVVVTDAGGAKEALVEGVTGFSVPRSDVESLAARLRTLECDPVLRARLGEAGRRRFETHFTFERMFDQTMTVYRDVLTRSARTAQQRRGNDEIPATRGAIGVER